MKGEIHIALGFDQNYIAHFYTVVTSIFFNNSDSKIIFHIIATGLEIEEKDRIVNFVKKNNSQINFYEIDEKYVKNLYLNDNDHFTVAIYYRLFFPLLISEDVKKLLYLDTDIVVIGDLKKVYNLNLGSYPVAAALDNNIEPRPELGVKDGSYFNSGVLLINTVLWRNQNISQRAVKFLQESAEIIRWPDQDALNAVLTENYLVLDNIFNITIADIPFDLPKSQYKKFLKDKVIIHFTTANKPWFGLGVNKFRYLYHYYLLQSPYPVKVKYVDFKWEIKYLKEFTKIRLMEGIYFSYPSLGKVVRKFKRLLQ